MEKIETPSRKNGAEATKEIEGSSTPKEQRTPVRVAKSAKRKIQSPSTPTGASLEEFEKSNPGKKQHRRGTPGRLKRPCSPTSLFKPPLTERQQLALLMQMTDVNRHIGSGEESSPRSDVSRSRIQRRNERGETPLHVACIKGDLKQVTALLGQGADVNATDNACWTPLHEACNHGHVQVVMYLLEKGANVNAEGMGGDTPLHDAVLNQHKEVIQALLNHGADPSKCNEIGKKALDVCKDADIAALLEMSIQNEALCTESGTGKGEQVTAAMEESALARERSPAVRERSPAVRERSPAVRERSPAVRERSPAVRERSPAVRERSPAVRERSPAVRERSPAVRERSPAVRERSPAVREGSPSVRARSSVGREGSPTNWCPGSSEVLDGEEDLSTTSSRIKERGIVVPIVISKDEAVVSLLLTSSEGKEGEETSVQSNLAGDSDDEGVISVLPPSPRGEEGEGVISDVHTSSSGKDEENLQHLKDQEVEEFASDLPSSSVEEEGEVTLLPSSRERVEGKEEESVSMLPVTSNDKEVWPSSSSTEEFVSAVPNTLSFEEKMSTLPSSSNASVETSILCELSVQHPQASSLGIRMEAALSNSLAEMEEEPSSSTMCDHEALSVNKGIWSVEEGEEGASSSVEEGEEPSSTVEGPKETASVLHITTCEVVEDGSSASMKKDVKVVESEEFYSDISSSDDEMDYIEQMPAEGGRKRMRLRSRGSKVSPEQPSGTESLMRATKCNPVSPGLLTEPTRTGRSNYVYEHNKPVAMGDHDSSVSNGPVVVGKTPVQHDKRIVPGHSGVARNAVMDITSSGSSLYVGDRTVETSVGLGKENVPGEAVLPDQLILPAGEVTAFKEGVPDTADEDVLTTTSATENGAEKTPAEGNASDIDGEALPSGLHSSSPSSPNSSMPIFAAPPIPSPPDMQMELCVSFPLSLLNLCRETLVRLHQQGSDYQSAAEPESFEESSHVEQQQQQEYVAMETMCQDDQERLSGGKEPRSHHDRVTRHSRKPQQVFSSKRLFKEVDTSGLECTEVMGMVETSDVRGEEGATFSVRAGWGVLPSSSSSAKKGKGQRDSPVPSNMPQGAHVRRKKSGDVGKGKSRCDEEDGEEEPGSAVVSLVASLPLSVVSRPGSGSPLGHTTGGNAAGNTGGNAAGSRSPLVYAEAPKPSSSHRRGLSGQQSALMGSQHNLSAGGMKDFSKEHDLEDLALPPKKRFYGRMVQRSMVVQRRREKREPAPVMPTNIKSFLLTSQQYRSKQIPQPTNPKSVYPPIHSSMYKLFNEHELERLRLLSAHATELDHMVISFEEELVRVHQKANRKTQPPLSVCAFLLEQMLPHVDVDDGRMGTREEGITKDAEYGLESVGRCPPSKEATGGCIDSRLLTSFVQDVWDKYLEVRTCTLNRQGHECEALWLLQLEQWKDRQQELGFSSAVSREVLLAHVPMVTSIKMSAEED